MTHYTTVYIKCYCIQCACIFSKSSKCHYNTMSRVCVTFSQACLLVINFAVSCLGVVAISIGLWAATTDHDYLSISGSDKNYDSAAVLLAVVGFFILMTGVVGFVGVLAGKKMCGRILVMAYAIVMAIIVVIAVSGAAAAYVERDHLEDTFRKEAQRTLNNTHYGSKSRHSYLHAWNDAQRTVHCCGANSLRDWLPVNWTGDQINQVPHSCCAAVHGCPGDSIPYPPPAGVTLWQKGCVDVIVDTVSDQIKAVAGISVAIGVIMVIAVVLACIVSIFNKRTSGYELV